MNNQQPNEVTREYARIGVREGERLPMPRGLERPDVYLAFLRQVPDGSGTDGFVATMKQWVAARQQ
jgi:hypothetical protein